jgi:hypothetical protein
MKSKTTITILAALCVAEGVFIVGLVGGRAAFPPPLVELAQKTEQSLAGGTHKKSDATGTTGQGPAPAELAKQNQVLETKLAEVTKELDARKSEISFSYGSVHDSGRFVGMTFRKMFETAAARESKEIQERTADNQINVLSLGPFIQDAEVFESDPSSFAQFQAPLISEVLGLPPEKNSEIESLLADLKTKSLKLEEGSAEWMQLNDTALEKVKALLPESRRQAMKAQLDFLQQYGVLVIPAYSILRAPTPTVVQP